MPAVQTMRARGFAQLSNSRPSSPEYRARNRTLVSPVPPSA